MIYAPVSVIVPCYRCDQTIDRAVDSIVLQSMRPKEVILVNDGNDKGTQKAIEQTSKKAGKTVCIKIVMLERNSGPATARNEGWNCATQPYIAFLDADESWHPQKIELQYKWMAANASVLLTGHGIMTIKKPPLLHQEVSCINAKQIGKVKLLLANRFPTSTVMCKKDIPFRFAPGKRYSEDYLLWLSVALRGYPLYHLKKPLSFRFKAPFGEGGLSSHLWKMEIGQLDTYQRIFREQLIGYCSWLCLSCFSLIKFARRLIIWFIIRKKNK